jgi:hypothetical protein
VGGLKDDERENTKLQKAGKSVDDFFPISSFHPEQ